MDRNLIKDYIYEQPIKVVTALEFSEQKIKYDAIVQNRKIDVIDGDEEVSRAFLLTKLVNELGYLPERIEIEHEYSAGRAPKLTPRIDVVVRDAVGNAFLFIEVKSPSEYATIDKDKTINDQLYQVAALEKASGRSVKYLVLYTTSESSSGVNDECIIIDMDEYPTFDEWAIDRNSTNEIPARYGKAQRKPYIKGSEKDL